jgi:RNA polymerase sigma-70 factor (ECF subfamily)
MPVARPQSPAQSASSSPGEDEDREHQPERDGAEPHGAELDGASSEAGPAGAVARRPALPTVNNRHLAASNTKEARVREAEEDRVFIARAQAGDPAAFRRLVERHQRRAFAIALSMVRDENDARELVQDAFLRVHKSLPSFQGGSSFFTWLYRIITNLSIDLIRKPGRQMAELDAARTESEDAYDPDFPLLAKIDGADPADVVRRKEIAVRVQLALDALPSYHRGVIVMREVEGLSYEEMAEAMGVSKGTIMSRLFHARQKLQKALADCYSEQIGAPPESAPPGSDAGSEGAGVS